jgi:DNA-binding NarL/FixJ family response regulator
MIALAIDDEQLMLYALEKAVRASEDVEEVIGFTSSDKALE